MVNSEFIRSVEDACESALVAAGFKRLRRGTIIWEISPSFWGWVGLNEGNHGDMVRINPFIGIHAVDLMKLWDQLDESKYSKGAHATYAIHLGEILPDELVFEFHKGKDLSHDAARLAKCVADTGLKYMQSIADYDELIPLFKEFIPTLGGYPERYALALHLSGKHAEAREFVLNSLNKDGELARISNNSILKFAANFLKMTKLELH
jgi:hypothetical protein